MQFTIGPADKAEYSAIVDVWEASVRATHEFLPERDILFFKPLILNNYLDAVQLRVMRDEHQRIVGFVGAADQCLEMLFLHPAVIGKGLGKKLVDFAINEWGIRKVDVNEQNGQAVSFYKRLGFRQVGRSELDALGKPYPILHLELPG